MIKKKFKNPLLIHLSILEAEIEDYADAKKDWFMQFLELKNGIPSHDTFRRIFCILEFEEFQRFFIKWTSEIRKKLNIKNDQICIDGKTLRRCFKSRASKALHMVSAWSSGTSLSLGQVATEDKSQLIAVFFFGS